MPEISTLERALVTFDKLLLSSAIESYAVRYCEQFVQRHSRWASLRDAGEPVIAEFAPMQNSGYRQIFCFPPATETKRERRQREDEK